MALWLHIEQHQLLTNLHRGSQDRMWRCSKTDLLNLSLRSGISAVLQLNMQLHHDVRLIRKLLNLVVRYRKPTHEDIDTKWLQLYIHEQACNA